MESTAGKSFDKSRYFPGLTRPILADVNVLEPKIRQIKLGTNMSKSMNSDTTVMVKATEKKVLTQIMKI